jgi:short-subunit dehydrogenase
MIKAVLPFMRKRRAGHIINITSMGGYIILPGIGYYCGSKFALEAISETLSKEVRDFGIRVSAIVPGQFRTDWAGRSMTRTERTISDYDKLMDPVRKARQNKSGKQPGDAAKAAQVLLQIIEAPNPPTHLLLGDGRAEISSREASQPELRIRCVGECDKINGLCLRSAAIYRVLPCPH